MPVYSSSELAGSVAVFPALDARGRTVRLPAVVAVDTSGNPVAAGSQTTPTHTKVDLAANTAATIVAAGAAPNGARILNWTASPIYVAPGVAGTPASGAPSDYIPAAAGGVPGQYEPPYKPVDGLRAVGASAGSLTVETW